MATTLLEAAPGQTLEHANINCLVHQADGRAGWISHEVVATRPEGSRQSRALFQLLSAPGRHDNAQMPTMVYMPEKGRLLLLYQYGPPPVQTRSMWSDDDGATWCEGVELKDHDGASVNAAMSVGLTYLENGVVTVSEESTPGRRFSDDFGATWSRLYLNPLAQDGKKRPHWDPLLIDRDNDGRITRLTETRWLKTERAWDSGTGPYSQGCVWFSENGGVSWGQEIVVPQWLGVNEVALLRARNGDIVAACRTDNPQRYIGRLDLYSGLGISRSCDDGKTWSPLDLLFEYGRHHPSLVLLPDGNIVMTYVVRCGYDDTEDGFPQFGIEAVVSSDNGRTWDLPGRYILATWRGQIQGENPWWGLSQSTTTALLPDGSLLTAFGTGVRNRPGQERCIMDTALVKWHLHTAV